MFGSKKKKVVEVRLEDAKKLLYNETLKEFEENEKKIKPALSDMIIQLSALKTTIEQFKSKSVPNTYANTVKNKYCDRCMEMLTASVPDFSYSELDKFAKNTEQALRTVENPDIKEFRHLFVFKSDMSLISNQTKPVWTMLKNYKKVIEKPFLKNRDATDKCIDWMTDMKNKIVDITDDVEKMKLEEKEKFAELIVLKNELEKNRKNYEDVKIENLNKDIDSLEKQRNSIKQKIDNDFGSIMRPVRKALHIAEDGKITFTKEDTRIANDYSMSEETFLMADNDNRITVIIEKIKDAIDNKKLIVDDREKDKVNMVFRSMDFFLTLKEQYIHIVEKIAEKDKLMNDTFGPFMRKRNEIETQIADKQKEIEQLKKIMHAKNEDKIRLSGKIRNDVNVLENNFMSLGIETKVSID
jgi:hypothetical protein